MPADDWMLNLKPEIRRHLNAINRAFYRVTADAFDQTRSQAWEGWHRLLDDLPPMREDFSVLDVGCGNGRFGVFLAEQFPHHRIHYHGIDSSPALLTRAQTALTAHTPPLNFQLEQRDLIEEGLSEGETEYDLVVLFGVLHHVPGFIQRQQFIADLAKRVKPDGLLAFTTWRFYEFERFRSRIIPWPPELAAEVEAHDYLLDWRRGATAVRYCHYVDQNEWSEIIKVSGKSLIAHYDADGREAFNRYIALGNV